MTCLLTPDGKPFYAGTFFPREQFDRPLEAVGEAWRDNRGEVLDAGQRSLEGQDLRCLLTQWRAGMRLYGGQPAMRVDLTPRTHERMPRPSHRCCAADIRLLLAEQQVQRRGSTAAETRLLARMATARQRRTRVWHPH